MKSREKALAHFRKFLRSQDRGEELPMSLPTKKVSVIADSKEGLEKGLEKAEDILEGELPDLESASEFEEDSFESPEEDLTEDFDDLEETLTKLSPEQLQALMEKIKSLI